jgi:hypothetical protein
MALTKTLWVTKWARVRATRVIVTNAIAAVAVVLASAVMAAIFIAAAATTIAQRCCPQRSHCSSYRHHPPLWHSNQMAMAWVMATEAMATTMRVVDKGWQLWQWQWQQNA